MWDGCHRRACEGVEDYVGIYIPSEWTTEPKRLEFAYPAVRLLQFLSASVNLRNKSTLFLYFQYSLDEAVK